MDRIELDTFSRPVAQKGIPTDSPTKRNQSPIHPAVTFEHIGNLFVQNDGHRQ